MRFSSNSILNLRNITFVICLMFSALSVIQAQTPDVNKIWTTVGSDGTVDETDTGKVFFDRSMVQMGRPQIGPLPNISAAPIPVQIQSAVIRYNVTPVNGLFVPMLQPCSPGRNCEGPQLTVRFLAAGNSGRVAAKLIEVDLATGVETTRLTFNSTLPNSNRYRVESGSIGCSPLVRFDFRSKAYYIEATLTTGGIVAGSAAGVQMIKINKGVCIN